MLWVASVPHLLVRILDLVQLLPLPRLVLVADPDLLDEAGGNSLIMLGKE